MSALSKLKEERPNEDSYTEGLIKTTCPLSKNKWTEVIKETSSTLACPLDSVAQKKKELYWMSFRRQHFLELPLSFNHNQRTQLSSGQYTYLCIFIYIYFTSSCVIKFVFSNLIPILMSFLVQYLFFRISPRPFMTFTDESL